MRKRGVVAVDTDGSIKWYFESRTEAEKYTKTCHKDMGRALRDHYYTCKGYKWYYEDVYRDGWMACGEEQFLWKPSTTHRRFGTGFLKGHTLGNGHQTWSAERRAKQSEAARKHCLMRKENGGYVLQGLKYRKPVRCVNDGMEFDAIKIAAAHYGIPPCQISSAIKRNGTAKSLKFVFV